MKWIIISSIIAFIVYSLISKKFDLLDAFAFLLPFKSLVFDFGLHIWPFYIPFLLLYLHLFLFRFDEIRLNRSITIFLTYSVIATLLLSFFVIDTWMINFHFDSYFRGKGRFFSSLVKLVVFEFGIVLVLVNTIRSERKIFRLLQVYLYSLFWLCVIGIFQLFYSILFGKDIFISSGLKWRGFDMIGNDLLFGVDIIRVNSLGGEPKGFGMSLLVGIIFLFFSRYYNIRLIKQEKILIFLFFTMLIFTLSSGAYALLGLSLFLIVAFGIFKFLFFGTGKKIFITLPLFILGIVGLFNKKLGSLIESRLISRSDQLLSEESEFAIQMFFLENPLWLIFGSGVGNIHHVSFQYLPVSILHYKAGHIFIARYGYSRLISEGGIVSFLIFIFIVIMLSYKLYRINDLYSKFFLITFAFLTFYYFARSNYVFSEFLFLVGLIISFLTIRHRDKQLFKS